jgi:hypothetical protein
MNIGYPISNIEGKQPVYLQIGVSFEFGAVILHKQKREHFIIRHSLLDIGYSVDVTWCLFPEEAAGSCC